MALGTYHALQMAILYQYILSIPKHRPLKTVVDVDDIHEVERLVRFADSGNGIDDLMDRLTRIMERFPPNEEIMQRLSLMQQKYMGTGNLKEFCITCVYIVAMEVVVRKARARMCRIRSTPCVKNSAMDIFFAE